MSLKLFSVFQINQIEPVFIPISEDYIIGSFDISGFPANSLGINQLSPMLVKVMEQISLKTTTNYDLPSAYKVAGLVSRFNSKAEYIRLVEQNSVVIVAYHVMSLLFC
ncbi:hypothetical protein KJ966_28395 [bacterium]|nr:hypothetical protein [bacterium]